MTWRLTERLVDLSRTVWSDRSSADGKPLAKTAETNVAELPEDETSAAIRSRQVFDALAKPPLGDDGRAELDVSRVAEAMSMCGLDGRSCAAMYALSRWAPTGPNGEASALDLDSFQFAVERFSVPARFQRQLHRDVIEYMSRRGLNYVYVVDKLLRTDVLSGCVRLLPKEQLENVKKSRENRLKYWDQILNGLPSTGDSSPQCFKSE